MNRLRNFFRQLDWRVALMLGPRHRFSPEQWRRMAHLIEISPNVKVAAVINALLLSLMLVWGLPDELMLRVYGVTLLFSLAVLGLGVAVWRRPTMKRLYLAYGISIFPLGVITGMAKVLLRDRPDLVPLAHELLLRGAAFAFIAAMSIWVLAMWRNEFLADWLHDEDERAQKQELAQRLSSAQIQPHFLFNSLASLQHWVNTRDGRAAPLLASLTAYLRATLPLFDRQLLAIGEEAEAVRRYLEVMQARLGPRLRFSLELDSSAAQQCLPPGVLLTLVENAVEHGVQTQLSGGEVKLRASLAADGALQVQVLDDGPGLPPDWCGEAAAAQPLSHAQGSLGLLNTRLRLQQAFGARASLCLSNRAEGGCQAELRVQAQA
ncbi:hypothetical protein DBR47_08410 [Paucibacter sp. KBW04]|uniref:sensor histidine kinase n=1 Tax=Paucibacter sp. KBW04 TaxID=2153361 RepID=UPI000F5679D6|nr:histidine kinase [Paucibacter sp. KBW04]RQO60380.1 hypothetical protein DBR47_08410 [Paucibacter sp. KBW04]